MSVVCTISNEVPEVPVINKKTGHVYEKRLIEKHINAVGTDPINGDPLSMDELIEIKVPQHVKPKPPTATSIPALLKSFQDESDSQLLYIFALKQQIQTLKQELSHSLYQYDAGCRVISRLTKEVTAAREALATLKPQAGVLSNVQSHGPVAQEMEVDETTVSNNVQEPIGMKPEIEASMVSCSQALTAERKRKMKQIPEDLAKPSDLDKYIVKASKVGFHSASSPGILALDISKKDSRRIITGGNDRNAVVYNTENEHIISILKGHTKKVTSVIYHPTEEIAITASPDSTIRVWNISDSNCNRVIRAHSSHVSGISLHATNRYILSSGNDGYWSFSDIETGNIIVRKESKNKRTDSLNSLTCMKSHPDGLICANGTEDGDVIIWNLKENREVAFLSHSTSAKVSSLAFSENGFYLATAGTDGQIKLWDLRKVKEFKSFSPGEERLAYQINDLEFDITGTYLGVAGSDVRVYNSRQWDKVVSFSEHSAPATGIRFGENSNTILSSSIDRSVKIYGQ